MFLWRHLEKNVSRVPLSTSQLDHAHALEWTALGARAMETRHVDYNQ
jgi:hypothetical protein